MFAMLLNIRLLSCQTRIFCGVTCEPLTPLLAGGHRPHEMVEGSVRSGPQVEICPHSLDHSWVCLRQFLDGCLIGQATGDVLPQESNDFMFFLAKVLGIHPSGSHDSQRECKTTRGHVISPWGGGMLGNFQQNSRILILSVYSLSNVCNN